MIDAHQHFWRIGRNDCRWPTPDLAAIHRDYEPDALTALATPLGVRGSVLIQSQTSNLDTDYLLDLADAEPFVKAVVGWVDLEAPTAVDRIGVLAARPKFRGVRPMLQDMAQDDWILSPRLEPAIAGLIANALCFDALVAPRHLAHLATFAARHPDLRLVVDHGGKPDIASQGLDPWREAIGALADLPHVHCKLSGLPTQAGPDQDLSALSPFIDHLLLVFGPERLMWGSDWPVLDLRSDYRSWLSLAQLRINRSDPAAAAQVFGRTAERFYRL